MKLIVAGLCDPVDRYKFTNASEESLVIFIDLARRLSPAEFQQIGR